MATASRPKDGAVPESLAAELDKLAVACRILEMEGHGSRTLGHVALRDPGGGGFWLKRWGITFGEVYDRRDFMLLDFDGNQLHGDGRCHSEWPIHAEIFKCRPDINVSMHSHPPYGRMFSASDAPLRAVSNAGSYFKEPPPRYVATSELIRTAEAGREMAELLGDHLAIFLRNHGVVFCGGTIAKATIIGIHLEEACREHLQIASAGIPWAWPEGEEQARKFGSIGQPRGVEQFFDFFRRKQAAVEALGHPAFPGKPVTLQEGR
jgi:ribulose-5-phosphate 4-epimerase/fuculose-1-phosphate aldolase